MVFEKSQLIIFNQNYHRLIFSEKDFLGQQLDDYVKDLPVPVHIIRQKHREGLIRARLEGAKIANGEVLTFLDAHIEASPGWLEPLLYEIKKDRTNVICPIIDVISDETFEFLTGSDLTYGGFNWKLNFRSVYFLYIPSLIFLL